MAISTAGKVVLSVIVTGLSRRLMRRAVGAVIGLGAAGYSVDYQSSFVDATRDDIGVEVSEYYLNYLDEVEYNPGCELCDIELFDVRDTLPYVGVFPTRPIESITTLYFHHTAADTLTPWSVIAKIGYQRGLGGMPYHWGLPRSGRIEILQHLEFRTNHTAGHNTHGCSAVFPGNYENYELNDKQKEAVEKLRRIARWLGIEEEKIHKEVRATACPGKYAAKWLLQSRS